jgi:hypothetical protein
MEIVASAAADEFALSRRSRPQLVFTFLRHTYALAADNVGRSPMVVTRNLGHADIRMVEHFYSRLSTGFVADSIRKLAPEFGTVQKGNVQPLMGS